MERLLSEGYVSFEGLFITKDSEKKLLEVNAHIPRITKRKEKEAAINKKRR